MKLAATLFLRAVLVLIAIAALTFLLWEPHLEGRNAHATPFAIYLQDPFLAFVYVAAIPFFVGSYQAFRWLTFAGRDREFSAPALRSVRIIRYCALALVAFVIVGEIIILSGDSDDRAGGVMIGASILLASIIVFATATVLERMLQKAADLEARHDPMA